MIIPEKIQAVGGDYYLSQDVSRLKEDVKTLEHILQYEQPNEKNKKVAEALVFQIKAKIYAIEYFDGGYLQDAYVEFKEFLSDAIPKAENAGYVKTHNILTKLLKILDCVNDVMKDAAVEIYRVKDDDGNAIAPTSVIGEVSNEFKQKIERLTQMDDTTALFGEKVKLFDIKTQAINDLKEVCDWCDGVINKNDLAEVTNFFKNNVTFLDDESGDKNFIYHQPFPDRSTITAKTIVLCTPLKSELFLFARAYAKEYNLKFAVFTAQSFSGKSQEFIEKIFEKIREDKLSCLFFGFAEYYEENEKYIIKSIIDYSINGGIAFPVDSKGDRRVYDDFYNVVKESGKSGMAVSYKYLSMPLYAEVISELESKGMINGADYEYVRKNFAFMGYCGLNKAVSQYVQGKNWKDEAKESSMFNEAESSSYLSRIPSQELFLDVAWKDLLLKRDVKRERKQFDYDSVKRVNPKNIEKILQKDVSIFAKCGLIIRYCTLGGDDVSVWQTLTEEEKSERLTAATRIISHVLQTENDPEVKVVPLSEWTTEGAGGLCCEGGKLILYRADCVEGYDWTVKCVAHEVFHSFQHTTVNNGWQEWHFNELGITRNRVPEWRYNFDHYNGNTSSAAYKIEIVECDARAFASDCFDMSSGIWNTIDLE